MTYLGLIIFRPIGPRSLKTSISASRGSKTLSLETSHQSGCIDEVTAAIALFFGWLANFLDWMKWKLSCVVSHESTSILSRNTLSTNFVFARGSFSDLSIALSWSLAMVF